MDFLRGVPLDGTPGALLGPLDVEGAIRGGNASPAVVEPGGGTGVDADAGETRRGDLEAEDEAEKEAGGKGGDRMAAAAGVKAAMPEFGQMFPQGFVVRRDHGAPVAVDERKKGVGKTVAGEEFADRIKPVRPAGRAEEAFGRGDLRGEPSAPCV